MSKELVVVSENVKVRLDEDHLFIRIDTVEGNCVLIPVDDLDALMDALVEIHDHIEDGD